MDSTLNEQSIFDEITSRLKLVPSPEQIMLESDDAYAHFPCKPDLYVSLKEWLNDNTAIDVDAPSVEEIAAVITLKVGEQTTVNISKIRRVK